MKARTNIGKEIRIAVGIVFVLAGSIILTFGQSKNVLNNPDAELKKVLARMEQLSMNYGHSEIDFPVVKTEKDLAWVAKEDKIMIEDWMISNESFSSNLTETGSEEKVKVENWMLDKTGFAGNMTITEEVAEEELKIEDWMLDRNHFYQEEVTEEPVRIEEWMTNPSHWK